MTITCTITLDKYISPSFNYFVWHLSDFLRCFDRLWGWSTIVLKVISESYGEQGWSGLALLELMPRAPYVSKQICLFTLKFTKHCNMFIHKNVHIYSLLWVTLRALVLWFKTTFLTHCVLHITSRLCCFMRCWLITLNEHYLVTEHNNWLITCVPFLTEHFWWPHNE